MDFSTPSVKQVSDFFMYLYQDLNRHPSNIDGYRTAIVDTLCPAGLHISQSSDLNRLLSSFHRDRSKSSRNLPKWNLSVVVNELTKAPFEPMKDIDLKHLTLRTANKISNPTRIPHCIIAEGVRFKFTTRKKEFTTEVHYGVHLQYWD